MAIEVTAPVSRNSPCPCGSGKRYKECHGAIAGASSPAPSAAPSPARPGYRAPGTEWAHLTEADRARYGAMMEQALAHQVAGRIEDSVHAYREVLVAAPRTHDALHMLGVLMLGRGELEEAELLILAAMELRPPYNGVRVNLELVREAQARRDRAHEEDLCAHALPLLADLALSRPRPVAGHAHASAAPMHLVGPLHDGDRNDVQLMKFLASTLAGPHLTLWATDHSAGAREPVTGARAIDAAAGWYPREGTMVFAGVRMRECEWLHMAQAERAIVFCAGGAPSVYLDQLRNIARDGALPIDLIFPSHAIAAHFGDRGHVLPWSSEFASASGISARAKTATPRERWTLGIAAGSGLSVREAADLDFLERSAAAVERLAIYDPGRLRYRLGGDPRVRFVSRVSGGLGRFLHAVDCFCYRPARWWEEDAGGGILPALAHGVPALIPRASAFAEYVTDGVDALLYDGDDEALDCVRELRAAPDRAQRIGTAARSTYERLFDPAKMAALCRSLVHAAPRNDDGIEHPRHAS